MTGGNSVHRRPGVYEKGSGVLRLPAKNAA